MPVNMERRYKKDSAPWRAQQLARVRLEVNRKRTIQAEYKEALELAAAKGKPPPEPPLPFIMKRADSDDLFADNREFEQGNGFGLGRKNRSKAKKINKEEEKRQKEAKEKEEKEKAEEEALRLRRRIRESERRKAREWVYMNDSRFMSPYGMPQMGYQPPPFYPPAPIQPYAFPGYYDQRSRYSSYQAPPPPPDHMRPQYDKHESARSASPSNIPDSRRQGQQADSVPRVDSAHRQPVADERRSPSNTPRRENNRDLFCHGYDNSIVPMTKQISSSHPLLQPPTSEQYIKRASEGCLRATYGQNASVMDQILSDSSKKPSTSSKSSDSCMGPSKSRFVEHLGTTEMRDRKPHSQDINSEHDSPTQETVGPIRLNSMDDALDEINQSLYLEVELMLANMNASLSKFRDQANRRGSACAVSETNQPSGSGKGLITLENMPRRLRDIILSRKQSVIGLDVDIGSKDAFLHIDVNMAFQAMKDEPSVSRGDFDFDKEENYSEGLSAVIRRQDSTASVFQW